MLTKELRNTIFEWIPKLIFFWKILTIAYDFVTIFQCVTVTMGAGVVRIASRFSWVQHEGRTRVFVTYWNYINYIVVVENNRTEHVLVFFVPRKNAESRCLSPVPREVPETAHRVNTFRIISSRLPVFRDENIK